MIAERTESTEGKRSVKTIRYEEITSRLVLLKLQMCEHVIHFLLIQVCTNCRNIMRFLLALYFYTLKHHYIIACVCLNSWSYVCWMSWDHLVQLSAQCKFNLEQIAQDLVTSNLGLDMETLQPPWVHFLHCTFRLLCCSAHCCLSCSQLFRNIFSLLKSSFLRLLFCFTLGVFRVMKCNSGLCCRKLQHRKL